MGSLPKNRRLTTTPSKSCKKEHPTVTELLGVKNWNRYPFAFPTLYFTPPRNSISVLVHHAAHADGYALLRSVLSNGQILKKRFGGPENVFFSPDCFVDQIIRCRNPFPPRRCPKLGLFFGHEKEKERKIFRGPCFFQTNLSFHNGTLRPGRFLVSPALKQDWMKKKSRKSYCKIFFTLLFSIWRN